MREYRRTQKERTRPMDIDKTAINGAYTNRMTKSRAVKTITRRATINPQRKKVATLASFLKKTQTPAPQQFRHYNDSI